MYIYASKTTHQSAACPGAGYTLRQVSYGRRNAIAQEVARNGGDSDDNAAARMTLLRAVLHAMLVDVSGLEIDGRSFAGLLHGAERDAALNDFIDTAPEPLVDEIFGHALAALKLTPDAEKNSAPPSGMSCAATEGGSIAASANSRG